MGLSPRLARPGAAPSGPLFPITMETINILAISNRGRSRIGSTITTAIVEQNHHDKLFIVLPQFNQCRWIKKTNDPDFRIVPDN